MAERRNRRTKRSAGSRSNRNPNPASNSDDDWMRFICDETGKAVVPVLPRFQAVVPKWTNPNTNKAIPDGYRNDPETSKWLGTLTWPGCNCSEPGSVICVKLHVAEESARLRDELGPAFDAWKLQIFDELEDYFWDWTFFDFNRIMNLLNDPAFKTSTFLTKALRAVPAISRRREILKYYVHILVPNRLAEQTRKIRSAADLSNIDSDDDEGLQAKKEKYLSR